MANQTNSGSQAQSQNSILSSYSNTQSNAQISPQSNAAGQTQQASQGQAQPGNPSANRAVIGVFNEKEDAEEAISELRTKGFSQEEINIVTKEDAQRRSNRETYDDDISDGAVTGGTIGGIGGLLLGAGVVSSIGALAIPGIGPIIASGPIAAAIGGAVAGGIAGGLIDWGIPEEASRRYEESVARGGILAVVKTTSAKVDAAAQILRHHGADDIESHNTK
jgi:uncharacterized membrane protein